MTLKRIMVRYDSVDVLQKLDVLASTGCPHRQYPSSAWAIEGEDMPSRVPRYQLLAARDGGRA